MCYERRKTFHSCLSKKRISTISLSSAWISHRLQLLQCAERMSRRCHKQLKPLERYDDDDDGWSHTKSKRLKVNESSNLQSSSAGEGIAQTQITKSQSVSDEIFRRTSPTAFRMTWIILTNEMETPRVAGYLIRVDSTLRCTCTQQLRWKSGVENPSKWQYTYAACLVYSNPLSLKICKERKGNPTKAHLLIYCSCRVHSNKRIPIPDDVNDNKVSAAYLFMFTDLQPSLIHLSVSQVHRFIFRGIVCSEWESTSAK